MYNISSSVSGQLDDIFLFFIVTSVILLFGITAAMIYFVVRYSRKRNPVPTQIKDNIWLEIIWTVIPTILVLVMFYYGYEGYRLVRDVPDDAMVVHVTGRMWDWSFEYENGKKTDKLYVPVTKPVKLILTSVDVIHSFYIPAFRIKEDVVPEQETYLWFKPQTTGPADIFCAEFCGQRHAYMLSQVIVMPDAEYMAWYEDKDAKVPVGHEKKPDLNAVKIPEKLQALLSDRSCLDCHVDDDPDAPGPPLKGIYGKKRIVILPDGSEKEVIVDEDYLRKSLLEPGAEVLKGQTNSMPPAEDLTEEQIKMLIQYMKELK